jgi:hypothetical protein
MSGRRGWWAAMVLGGMILGASGDARALLLPPEELEGGGGGGGGYYPPPPPPKYFGTFCQEEFVDMGDLEWQDAMCNGFDGIMDNTYVHSWDVRTEGAYIRDGWMPANDGSTSYYGPDRVDIAYFGGHGYAGQIVIANVDGADLRFNISQVRWGDSARQLKVVVANACNTLTGVLSTIWSSTFWGTFQEAGLKIWLGAVDLMYNTFTGRDERFAEDLMGGDTFDHAWRDNHNNWPLNEHPAVATTGTSCTDCWYRLDNMREYNYLTTFPRLTGAQAACFCRRNE